MMQVMLDLKELKEKVVKGYQVSKEEAMELVNVPLQELCDTANQLRKCICGNRFDMCTIINGKSGKCSEDCKFCAQSAFHHTQIETYPLLGTKEILQLGKYNQKKGVKRYSIVTSGKKLGTEEIEQLCDTVKVLKKETNLHICVSLGLLKEEEFVKIKAAGVTRVHNNLETSRRNFPNVCTTHKYEDKIHAIENAKRAGLVVCSGGIMGLGETMEDRIDMALELRELGIRSIPINMLNALPGTSYADKPRISEEELCRVIAIYRFLIPDGWIRMAGGRGLLKDMGKRCFLSGANAAITGDMLTTSGNAIEQDRKMLRELGFELE